VAGEPQLGWHSGTTYWPKWFAGAASHAGPPRLFRREERARGRGTTRSVEAPLSSEEIVRPWRTATIVASLVASVELVLLLGGAAMLLAKPLSHAIRRHAHATAAATRPAAKAAPAAKPKPVHHAAPPLARSKTAITVLNGNGENGAAAAAAAHLHSLGYRIASTGNARRQDYATTVVLYRPGFQAAGARLAHDLHVKVVGPLDGIAPSSLHGGQLAVILGA
jgi:LytR cell envelope-related transcriptional attenuator